ncbi:MAG TPA: hypothetical protein PLH56_02070 [Candidatus Omnitrophota bacterium]|nr:hypothetical protein [Candidatus Omnitrophota bacterium]HPN88105.1 hypothetical protein [Candidatus Omnitrophota bacterium]
MTSTHQNLAQGRWNQMSFLQQMANIGSEVERFFNWRAKNNADYSQKAFERALELIDLTLDSVKSFPRLKELARVRETIVECFLDTTISASAEFLLKSYFAQFTYAARKDY